MENPVKMDDLGVPLFSETPIYIYTFRPVIGGLFFFPDHSIFNLAHGDQFPTNGWCFGKAIHPCKLTFDIFVPRIHGVTSLY